MGNRKEEWTLEEGGSREKLLNHSLLQAMSFKIFKLLQHKTAVSVVKLFKLIQQVNFYGPLGCKDWNYDFICQFFQFLDLIPIFFLLEAKQA